MKIELLDASHDRAHFDSGTPALDRYLRETARQHVSKGISKTWVLVDDDARAPKPVLGFFTLSICQVLADEFAENTPALRLGRLAVATSQRGKGLSKALLIEALSKAHQFASLVGVIGVFVEGAFYERFGFELAVPATHTLFLPMSVIEQLKDAT